MFLRGSVENASSCLWRKLKKQQQQNINIKKPHDCAQYLLQFSRILFHCDKAINIRFGCGLEVL